MRKGSRLKVDILKGLIVIVIFQLSPELTFASHDEVPSRELGLVLTWQQDPTSTMTIDWHTPDDGRPAEIEYKKVGGTDWSRKTGEKLPFPYSDRIINRVELTGLEAATEYRFRFDENSVYRKFRTMPDNAYQPIRFAAGGDVRHHQSHMERTNLQAMKYKPDFIIWGGDLAYADGLERRLYRWYEFMESMMNTLRTDDGRIVPVLAGIGNHEVLGGYYNRNEHPERENLPEYSQTDESRKTIAPYFFQLFAFPGQPGYGVIDFGDYMSVIILDTEHANPIAGEQTEWLESILAERTHIPHVFPHYHIPGYPSVRSHESGRHYRIRDHWVPLFEKYGVRVAFENHDHAYKRTFPLLDGKIDPNGIVYIGDGAWGVSTRPIGGGHDPENRMYHGVDPWYLDRASSERHFILGTIHGPHQHYLMINEEGKIIDEFPRTPHTDQLLDQFAAPWESAPGSGDE
jgi:acid phosphatase type 7